MKNELWMISLMCAALLAGGAAEPAAAQEAALWQRVEATYDLPAVARIRALVESLAPASVPAEPILEKALEGAAKGVPPERVLPALDDYAARLRRSTELLPTPRTRAGIVAGADALRRGVPEDAVRGTARAHPDHAPASLVVLGDLIEAGVPVEQARQAVEQALGRGHGPQELLDLPGVVRRRIREGHLPAEAARGAAASMGRGGPPPGMGPGGGPPGKPPVPPGAQGKGKGKGGGSGG